MSPRAALVGCLLAASACVSRTSSSPVLPPLSVESPARCEVVQQLAQAPIPDTLRGAEAFAVTGSGDAVYVHVKTTYGDIGHGRLTAGRPDLELHPGAATAERPALFIDYEERRADGLTRFLIRDLHDPSFVLPANEPNALTAFPYMTAGPDGWALIWSMKGRRPLHETLMFARLDATRRVHPAHPLVSGRLDNYVGIASTPSGYALASVEEVGRHYRGRLGVLLLDRVGTVQRRVALPGDKPELPRIAATSRGLTVVYSEGGRLVTALLDFAGDVRSPARELGVSGHAGRLVVHRDELWFAGRRSYCDGCSRGGWLCTAPPEAAAFHLASSGALSEFELVHGGDQVWQEVIAADGALDSINVNASLGPVVLGSTGERLLAAWTMSQTPQETPILHVAELTCPPSQ